MFEKEQTAVFAHIHRQNTADIQALQAAVETAECEKRELLEIIARQQDAIQSMEDDAQLLETRIAEKDRFVLARDSPGMKDLKSLRSSLSNADMKSQAIVMDAEPLMAFGAFLNEDLDVTSSNVLSFLEENRKHSLQIEIELKKAENDIDQFSRRKLDDGAQSLYMTAENIETSIHSFGEVYGVRNTELLANIGTPTTNNSAFIVRVLRDENNRLHDELATCQALTLEDALQIDNLQKALDSAKEEITEVKKYSLSSVVTNLEFELKDSFQARSELSTSLVRVKEELLQCIARIAEREVEQSRNSEELAQIKLQLGNMGMDGATDERNSALKENSKLIQGNLELGAQLSKLTTEFAQMLWDLQDAISCRDRLQVEFIDLQVNFRKLKQQELDRKSNCVSHRSWGTQTVAEMDLDSGMKTMMHSLELKLTAQEKLIGLLKVDLDDAIHSRHEICSDSQTLRRELHGMKKQRDELNSSIDGFLNNDSDKLPDESAATYKVALYEARKKNFELAEKLRLSERNIVGQKETIFAIGAQLAQQSLKLGEIEWTLKQKEEERASHIEKIEVMEKEKETIVEELNESIRQLDVMKRSGVSHSVDEIAERVNTLQALKSEAQDKLEAATKEMSGIDRDIVSLNNISNEAGKDISETAKQLAIEANADYSTQVENLLAQIKEKDRLLNQVKSNSDNQKADCPTCEITAKQFSSLVSKLDIEMSKSKAALQARTVAEESLTELKAHNIELQKSLNVAHEEAEVMKQINEAKLKSYHEMKKLMQESQPTVQTPTIVFPPENTDASIPIIVETEFSSLAKSKQFDAEVYTSTELLSSQLSRTSNLQLKLDAVLRENISLQDTVKNLKVRLSVGEDNARELKANEFRISRQLATQMAECSELSSKISRLQKDLAAQIAAKGELEAELISKSAQEKKSIFKSAGKSLKAPKGFGRSRTSSTSSQEAGSPSSPASEKASIEIKIIEERDQFANEIAIKSAEFANISKNYAEVTEELFKAKQDLKESNERNAQLIRDHEGELKGLMMSHTEVEECLQHQIQELTDQLMEPRPSQELSIESQKSDKDKFESRLNQVVQAEQLKAKQLETSLREAELEVSKLRLKVDQMENEFTHLSNLKEIERLISSQIIDAAQTMLEQTTVDTPITLVVQKSSNNDDRVGLEKIIKLRDDEITELKLCLENNTKQLKATISYSDNQKDSTGLKQKLLDLETQLSESVDKCNKAKREAIYLREQTAEISKLKGDVMMQCAQLEAKLFETSGQLKTKTETYNHLLEEKTNLCNRIDTTMWKLQAVQERCASAESKVTILEARDKRGSLSLQDSDPSATNVTKRDECASCIQLGNSINHLNASLVDWQSRCEKASMDITNIEWQKYSLEMKLKSAESEMSRLLQARLESEQTASELKDQVTEMRAKYRVELEESQYLQAQAEEKALSLEQAFQEAVKSYDKPLSNKSGADDLNTDESKTIELDRLQQECDKLNDALTTALDEVGTERKSSIEAQKYSVELQSALKLAHVKCAMTQANLNILEEKYQELLSSLASTKDELLHHKIDSASKNEVQYLEQSNAELLVKVSELSSKKVELQSAVLLLQSELDETKEKIMENHLSAEGRSFAFKERIRELEDSNERLEAKADMLEKEMKTHASAHNEDVVSDQNLRSELEVVRLQVAEYEKQFIIQDSKLQAQGDKFIELELELMEAKSCIKTRESRILDLETSVESLFSKLKTSQEELESQVDQLSISKSRVDELIKLSIVRTTNLKGKEEKIAELEMYIASLQSRLDKIPSAESIDLPFDAAEKHKSDLAKAKAQIKELIKLSIVRTTNLKGKEDRILELEATIAKYKSDFQQLNEKAVLQIEKDAKLERELEIAAARIEELLKLSNNRSGILQGKDGRIKELEGTILDLETEIWTYQKRLMRFESPSNKSVKYDLRISTIVEPGSSSIEESRGPIFPSPETAVNGHINSKEIGTPISTSSQLVEKALYQYLFRIYWQYLCLVFLM
ncbi:hypothetical protein BC830DRAFT_836616 [Chytriomyces sp. MP71]|nr:hypothetical protein BC830DRAFT_836616 [Chytriomyces sp. MP71]